MRTDQSDFHFGCTHQYQLQLMNPIMTPVSKHLITKQAKNYADMEDELEQCMG